MDLDFVVVFVLGIVGLGWVFWVMGLSGFYTPEGYQHVEQVCEYHLFFSSGIGNDGRCHSDVRRNLPPLGCVVLVFDLLFFILNY